MNVFPYDSRIDFLKLRNVALAICVFLLIGACVLLGTRGLNYALDFTGGTVAELTFEKPADLDQLRDTLESEGYPNAVVQAFGSEMDVMVRLQPREDQQNITQTGDAILAALNSAENPAKLVRSDFVGPQVGKELASDGAMALLLVIGGIVLYLAMRFEWRFAVSAIIANLHDVIIILGFFAFFQWEFSLPVLAAILAVLGYSVNESVVVFDRVRETFKKRRDLTTPQVLDHAITSTISRTIITHGSTQIMVLSMLLFGGPTLYYFALALTIGILFGIYSSVFVAAAIAMWLGIKREDLIKSGPKKEGDPDDPNAGAMV